MTYVPITTKKFLLQWKGYGLRKGMEELHDAVSENVGARFNRSIASLLDARIRDGYRLFPNNYIAQDLREGVRLLHRKAEGRFSDTFKWAYNVF